MGSDFKKACKYLYYLDEKQHYTETIANYNPVKDRFDIKPKVEGNSLVVNWPKAHEISNGQRDILTFVTLLLKTRNSFKRKIASLLLMKSSTTWMMQTLLLFNIISPHLLKK